MTSAPLESIRRDTLDVLRRHTTPGERVAFLDFPNYQNAGDALIYAGEVEYLGQLQVRIAYTCDLLTYNAELLRKRVGTGTILLRGGGNFGDRWPAHQKFREMVVGDHPGSKIVVLPQSIDYSSTAELESTRDVYARHRDLTLLIRERRSYDTASAAFPDTRVEYCPDLAFGADIAEHPGGSDAAVVKLMRTDSERLDHGGLQLGSLGNEGTGGVLQFDWGLDRSEQRRWNALLYPTRIAFTWPSTAPLLYPVLARSYPLLAGLNIRSAQRILNHAPVVLTDRLHAAVLAAMMGKRVVALDNANKKVSSIYGDYLHRFDNVGYAASAAEAEEQVRLAVANLP